MKVLNKFLVSQIRRKYKPIEQMLEAPIQCQEKVLDELISKAKNTAFGKDHGFSSINNYDQFKNQVPLRDFEALSPYIKRIQSGEKDILWPGFPKYFGISSGTTSKVKYIPVTQEFVQNHIRGPQCIGLNYSMKYGNIDYLKGKVLLFSDGLVFDEVAGLPTAPISSIKHSNVPKIYRSRSLPGQRVNSIPDFDLRMKEMVRTSLGQDVRSIVAMPVWFMTYLRQLRKMTGKTLKENFPNFQLLISSGMNYEPYLSEYREYIGGKYDILETYPSTEGFLGYQDTLGEKGLQLVLNKGIFFEFVPASQVNNNNPERVSLKDVEIGKDYALILNTAAGLWAYILGDVIQFKSLFPHRIEIRGRLSQFISAFGEHVITAETDKAINDTSKMFGASIVNYTVAPHFGEGELPYHEWFIEFGKSPDDPNKFEKILDQKMGELNFTYQKTVIRKGISPLKIRIVRKNGFIDYLKITGKTSMQQKIPAVNNDDGFAKGLKAFIE